MSFEFVTRHCDELDARVSLSYSTGGRNIKGT